MNNEEKILTMLEQMQSDISGMKGDIFGMKADISGMKGDIASLKQGQIAMQEDIAEIKEHAEVTRSATNSLVEWADTVGVITQVKFPIKKANNV